MVTSDKVGQAPFCDSVARMMERGDPVPPGRGSLGCRAR